MNPQMLIEGFQPITPDRRPDDVAAEAAVTEPESADTPPEDRDSADGDVLEEKASADGELEDGELEDGEPGDGELEDGAPQQDPPDAGKVTRRAPRVRTAFGLMRRIAPTVALVALGIVLVVIWRQNARMSDSARQRHEVTSSAGKVASTFFNWDYQHMDQSFAAKYPLLTKAAADAIRPTAATLTSYFATNKVSSEAQINGVYPGEIKAGAATVMVIINTKVTTAKTVQSNTGATVAISLKHVSGKWLAGNITLLSSGVESTTDQNGKPLANPGSAQPSVSPSARPTP